MESTFSRIRKDFASLVSSHHSPPAVIETFWTPHPNEFYRYKHQSFCPAPPTASRARMTKTGKSRKIGFCQRCGAPRTGEALATVDKHNPKYCDGVPIKFYAIPHPQPNDLWSKGRFSAVMYTRILGAMAQGKPVSTNFQVVTAKHAMSTDDPVQKDWGRRDGV